MAVFGRTAKWLVVTNLKDFMVLFSYSRKEVVNCVMIILVRARNRVGLLKAYFETKNLSL